MISAIKYRAILAMIFLSASGAFSGCSSMPAAQRPHPNTIAVWDFENLNPAELEEFNLGELLAAKVMERFESSGKWVMVERQQLILALEEQQLGGSELVSEETRLAVGKLLGAYAMVFGNYMKFMDTLQLSMRIVDVETGRIIAAVEKTIPFQGIGSALETAAQAASELQK